MTLLNLRTADAAQNRDALAMTCDFPLIREPKRRPAAPAQATCRPTGRSRQPRPAVRIERPIEASEPRPWRSNVRTQAPVRSTQRAGASSNTGTQQIWIASALTGLALALLVLVFGQIGTDYQNAVTAAPAQTQVVHVRSGESLSSLAARIAPELPAASVIATVRELNGLETTGLRPGQALVVPDYR